METKSRFSLMEMFIVVAILLIIAPLARPRVLAATLQPITGFFHQHVSR